GVTLEAGAGRVTVTLFPNMSRPEVHLAIVRRTFQEAGWGIAEEKIQLGWQLQLLGLGVSAEGGGALFVPEVKRRDLLQDIRNQRPEGKHQGAVPREAVEKLVGRLTHAAIVAPEGNAHLQPLYRVRCATYRVVWRSKLLDGSFAYRRVRAWPRTLQAGGRSAGAIAYQRALDWWQLALERGVSAPLAPKQTFPTLNERGSAFAFTYAAREEGTSFGGFTFVELEGHGVECWYLAQQWDMSTRPALQDNAFSMPAGEAYGAVVLLDAILSALHGVTHMICFTDSDATAKGLTSGAPQLNYLISWLCGRWGSTQFLGVHQKGSRNITSDRLSRGDRDLVLSELPSLGIRVRELSPTAEAGAMLELAKGQPLRLHD
ncbi:MAG: hypothetical protein SGPRY_009864, partial [Prymnesium sp.]